MCLEARMMKPQSQSDHLQPRNLFNKLSSLVFIGVFLLVVSSWITESRSLVKTLPGFLGDLPFTLETGYIGVGESDEVQLFYYFVESEGNPRNDPLIFWLAGGPGCSGLYGFFFETGPLTFNYKISTLEKQTLEIHPYSWTKGYLLGNPATDTHAEYNSRIQYAHHMALLSDAIYRSAKENCHGEYVIVDPNNSRCLLDLQVVNKCLEGIYTDNILEPQCHNTSNAVEYDLFRRDLRSLDNTSMHISSSPQVQKQGCRMDNYLYIVPWANSKEVKLALHVHEEFNEIEWVLCNETLRFNVDRDPISNTHNVLNVVPYHRRLTHKKCRALVYSGDHDLDIPYLGTLNWIESLNLLVVNDWRPWFVEEQVAGYTMKYSTHDYNLTFTTLKGAGHTGPEFKPKEGLGMVMRWLAKDDL